MDPVTVYSATYVLPMTGPLTGSPIRDGAVAVRRDRVLLAAARRDVRRAYPEAEEFHWPGVLTPGLVNAHTHLQYTQMAEVGRSPHVSFEAWSGAFDKVYHGGDAHDWAAAAREGARRGIAYGVTSVADVVTDVEAMPIMSETGLGGVAYLEVLGDTDETWEATGRDRLITAIREADRRGPIGISPHAPYTLDTGVLEDLAILARTFGLRQHIHAAESPHEREYTTSGTGPLARMVRELGFDFAILRAGGTGLGPIALLDALGVLGAHCHLAHGTFLDADDRALLRRRGTSVALCPRSNQTVGLAGPDVAALLAERNPICVGTDSLASSPSLNPLDDVRALRALAIRQGYREPDLDARLVQAATLGGARALGMAGGPGRIGTLGPGGRADLAVFAVDGTDAPFADLVATGRCVATVLAGTLHVADTSANPRR
ncbi:amidohydrolase family protein [Streptosporangiaceae bacterium NEAU-GS5]|nr:amidohydrolase family protein [Streptosporangiaceae bacterium NEAU-GS5]